MQTVIITDSCSDLPLSFIEGSNVEALSLTCHFKDEEYKDDFGKSISYKDFYNRVRNGETPTTSQINTYTFVEEFKKYISMGKSIIYIGFSSALSGCVASAESAKSEIMKEYPNADVAVVDTKSASLGQGLLVYYAYDMLLKGKSKEDIVNWLEDNKLKMNHYFTVESLFHLLKGGRISKTTAVLGTLLQIKPVLHVNIEGKLVSLHKVKGRKSSLKALAKELQNKIVHPEEQVIAISHGDCLEDANFLRKLVLDECKVKDIIINNVGPVIGSHSGPGTVALFFMGESR